MRHHSTAALCALVLGHTPARNSSRLSMLILEDDFCPRVPQKRWTGAIEAALTCSTPKFRISGHTHRMLSLGALFRASTVRETHGLSRLMYDFVQRIQSNSAVQYTCDADMWYANVARAPRSPAMQRTPGLGLDHTQHSTTDSFDLLRHALDH
mmetsp:Transcript_39588/g.97984  ORF Transcript_39588/g.97984 Transcript_39588/m.97984 type:complete len:153 (-) Transcript_39588:1076-1534(-)